MAEAVAISSRGVIWERCWDPGFCVHIPWPWNKDVCVSAHVCVRIAEDQGRYYAEIQLNGVSQQFDLIDTCYPALTIGLASLEVCTQDPQFDQGKLKSVRIVVKACVGIDFGPVHARRCFDLLNEVITFFYLKGSDLQALGLIDRASDEQIVVYVEGTLS